MKKATSEEREKVDQELPFAVMVFTLMAASGVSPYDSWKKLRKLSFLPHFKGEAEEVVRQVEVLGKDPMVVLHLRGEKTHSKLYRTFLGGFISSVKSGGKTVDYLKSELKTIFELRHNALIRSVDKIATLVEAYTVMLIVVLCTYILFVVFSATNMMDMLTQSSISISPMMSYILAFIIMPVLSLGFTLIAHNMQRSAFEDLTDLYKKALVIIAPVGAVLIVIGLVPSIQEALKPIGLPEIVTLGLALASLVPALKYRKISKINYNAEDSIPFFIRDVTESHKIGLSPEKSIIQAAKRKTYGSFSKFLDLMRSQIEWGIPLRKTFGNMQREIRSWFVNLNFAMLIETIEIGGNSTQSLELLSEYSEKEREVQINRRALLRPYIVLAFIWSGLVAVTTTIVALTTAMMTTVVSSSLSSVAVMGMQNQLGLFSVGIIFQCWVSGFFLGKISEGNLGAGFQYSAMLAVTAYLSLVLSQLLFSGMFSMPPATL
jgi:flagellar protein FlaJ